MTVLRPLSASACALALATLLMPAAAGAQSIWKWRDANGTLQISDQPPPRTVPDSAILARPGAPGTGAAAPAAAPAPEANASAPARRDPQLEARRKEQLSAEAAKQAEAKAQAQARRAEDCQRVRNHLASLESGMRIARTNDKGEREFLDDGARAAEAQRARDQLRTYCGS